MGQNINAALEDFTLNLLEKNIDFLYARKCCFPKEMLIICLPINLLFAYSDIDYIALYRYIDYLSLRNHRSRQNIYIPISFYSF